MLGLKFFKESTARIDASAYVTRFDQMPSWESCIHPVANFKKNDRGSVDVTDWMVPPGNIIGCNIMSLQRDFIGNFIDRLVNTLRRTQTRQESAKFLELERPQARQARQSVAFHCPGQGLVQSDPPRCGAAGASDRGWGLAPEEGPESTGNS